MDGGLPPVLSASPFSRVVALSPRGVGPALRAPAPGAFPHRCPASLHRSAIRGASNGKRPAAPPLWPQYGRAGAYGASAADPETGLALCGLRYYDPSQGRFLNRDPSGYQGGINLYGYVHNSPTALTDPTGLGGDDMWYDVSGNAWAGWGGALKGFVNAHLADPSLGFVGRWAARKADGYIDQEVGLLRLPQMLGHLAEGTECFWDHPSWSTLPGLVRDLGAAGAALGGVGAAGFAAELEGAAATASDVGSVGTALRRRGNELAPRRRSSVRLREQSPGLRGPHLGRWLSAPGPAPLTIATALLPAPSGSPLGPSRLFAPSRAADSD